MAERSGDSLEFYTLQNDDQLVEFSRSSFRVRVAERENFFLQFGELNIPLADISIGGISLLTNSETAMALGDILCNCELTLGEEHFSGLIGRVVHHSLDGSGRMVTGIQWLDLNPMTLNRLQDLLSQMRQGIFKRD